MPVLSVRGAPLTPGTFDAVAEDTPRPEVPSGVWTVTAAEKHGLGEWSASLRSGTTPTVWTSVDVLPHRDRTDDGTRDVSSLRL